MKAYQAYRSVTSPSRALSRPRTSSRAYGGSGGAMLAASTYRAPRRRRLPRKVRYRRKIARAKKRRFVRKVKRIANSGKPPKWHIYRNTALLSPGSSSGFTTTGQTTIDIAHGTSAHYDGLVMLQAIAKNNVTQTAPGPPPTFEPYMNDQFLHVKKSYMVLYMTNNSATSVYGKMAVFKPRKHINAIQMFPGPLANADLAQPNAVRNEWLNPVSIGNLGYQQFYNQYEDMAELVGPTGLTDMGWIWQNSPSFRRIYKAKVRTVNWAPMECKKFIFKMKKHISIDTATEYTGGPATTAAAFVDYTNPGPFSWVITPTGTGFAEMHAKRGFFVSFLLHGIPARDADDLGVGLTQPKMDLYWLNAYKYGWSELSRREFHVSTPNPLNTAAASVAIPGFGTVAGPPQVGG